MHRKKMGRKGRKGGKKAMINTTMSTPFGGRGKRRGKKSR